MADTGLSTVLSEVYGESTLNQMIIGKAYSRALRGHLLVDQVLSRLMFEIKDQNLQQNEIIEKLENIHGELISSKLTLTNFESNPLINSLNHHRLSKKVELQNYGTSIN